MTPQATLWLARFQRYLGTERRLSVHTLSAYRRDLGALRVLARANELGDALGQLLGAEPRLAEAGSMLPTGAAPLSDHAGHDER